MKLLETLFYIVRLLVYTKQFYSPLSVAISFFLPQTLFPSVNRIDTSTLPQPLPLSSRQDLLLLPGMWSPPSTRPQLSWTGAGRRTQEDVGISLLMSSANAAVVLLPMGAPVGLWIVSLVEATSAFCQEQLVSTTPPWQWVTCWLILITPSRLKHRMAYHHWLPKWDNMLLSPLPPIKQVRII